MDQYGFSGSTVSPSTEKMFIRAGRGILSGKGILHSTKLQDVIADILNQDGNIRPVQIPPLTEQLCGIIGNYTFETENLLTEHIPEFGRLEPGSKERQAVLLELLSAGQYRGCGLYDPVNTALNGLKIRTETYQRLYSAAREIFCSDLDFVQRVAYAARSFPFFSALKRLLLKPYRPGMTYYEYICDFSKTEPSRAIQYAARTGNYQFGNEEAFSLLDKLVLHETGKKNVFQRWKKNDWLPVDIQSDTVFACAYAFSLPLLRQQGEELTADYLFEHVETSVTDALNAEQDILRFGLWVGLKYQEADQLVDTYAEYYKTAEIPAQPSGRGTVDAAIMQFFQGQDRNPDAFLALLASHGVQPIVRKRGGQGPVQKDDAHLKENLLELRTRAAQHYMRDIFWMTEFENMEELLLQCCKDALCSLDVLKEDGYLNEVSDLLNRYFNEKEKHRLMDGEQLYEFFEHAYRFDTPDKAADVMMCGTDADRLTARLLEFLGDGKKVLQDAKYCNPPLTEERILKMRHGEPMPGKRGIDRNMILRLAYLHTVIAELTDRIEFQTDDETVFDRFLDTANQWLAECLFLPFQPSFMTDAIFCQVFQDEQTLFRPLVYQIFLPRTL